MKSPLRFVISHPIITLMLLAIATACLAPGVAKLTFNNRLEAFMPKGDVDYLNNLETKRIYGDNSRYFVISVTHDEIKGEKFFSAFHAFIEDLEAFETYPQEEMEDGLSKLTAFSAAVPVQKEALLEQFLEVPVFHRLLLRSVRSDKSVLESRDMAALISRVQMTLTLMAEEPVARVLSPFTVSDIRAEGDDIYTGEILEEDDDGVRILPHTAQDRARLFERLKANPSFESGVYAANEGGEITDFGVVVTFSRRSRVDLISRAVIDICKDRPILTVIPQGSPVVNVWFNTYMQTDLKRFLPLVVLVMAITFCLNFRSVEGLLLPLSSLLLATVWIMGLMGHLGLAITPLGISLPTLMVSVGSSYAIHIYNQYLSERDGFTRDGFAEGLISAMEHITPTVLFAGLTTFIAFATLASSKLSAVREWGLLSAVGVLFSMVVASTLIPSILVLRHGGSRTAPTKTKAQKSSSRHPVDLAVRLFSYLAIRYPAWVVVGTLVVVTFCTVGMTRIQVESDFLAYFKESDYVRTSAKIVDEKFKGRWGFNLLVDSGKEGGVYDPAFLAKLETVRQELASTDRMDWNIGRTDSITDFLKIMNRAMNGDDPSYYKVPKTPEDILDYFEIFGGEDENDDGRPDDFEALFDGRRQVANIVCRFYEDDGTSVGTTRMGIIMAEIEAWTNAELSKGMSATITGFPKIDVKITRFITWGQLSSLGLSLLVIFLIVLVRFKSVHGALLSLVPMSTAVIINFGVMGWLGINLDMLTSIIASITIGIGVDDTIHFLNTYRQRTLFEHLPMEEAVEKTLAVSGRAITYTSFALIAGFLVLVSSNFIAVILFGVLMTLTMVATTIGALLVLPSLILLTGFFPKDDLEEGELEMPETTRVEKLIALFRTVGTERGSTKPAVTHLMDQTEESYQQEQAEWLKRVKDKDKPPAAR